MRPATGSVGALQYERSGYVWELGSGRWFSVRWANGERRQIGKKKSSTHISRGGSPFDMDILSSFEVVILLSGLDSERVR